MNTKRVNELESVSTLASTASVLVGVGGDLKVISLQALQGLLGSGGSGGTGGGTTGGPTTTEFEDLEKRVSDLETNYGDAVRMANEILGI